MYIPPGSGGVPPNKFPKKNAFEICNVIKISVVNPSKLPIFC
jgi:hypothetical protein